MIYVLYTLHIVICLFLILVVLLQQGSGADLSVFGGGGTQTAFGARSATNLLHKMTVAGFVGFILTTISIGFLRVGSSQGSVMTGVTQEQATPAVEEAPAAEVPVDLPTVDDLAEPVAPEAEAGAADPSTPSEDGNDDTGGQETGG
ncbi:MAG: preprotein translocase subunit SecG [Acidobacteriota bacterium]|nr:preprotein translocase subunit SecG [Acidobacteriota bacterium]